MRLLITAFEPFEGSPTNCTELVVGRIERLRNDGDNHPALAHTVRTAVLPVADRTAAPALHAALEEHEPDLVIALGEAAARTSVGIERLAINLRDYRIPDNEGAIISDKPIVADGPAAYFASLALHAMREAFERRSIPVRLSRDAGTFLCNQVMYELLHRFESVPDRAGGGVRAGFLHLPLVAEQLPEIVAGHRNMPRPGSGVFDATASDGSPIEAITRHWHRTLATTAVPLEVMTLGVLDAVATACELP